MTKLADLHCSSRERLTASESNVDRSGFGLLARVVPFQRMAPVEQAGVGRHVAPRREVIIPAAKGTAEGKVVIDKLIWNGQEIRGLTLEYRKGKLASMTPASNIDALKARYDAATGGKDQFAWIDIGVNPETRLPLESGRVVWTAPGSVAVGLGDNRGFGGTNASDFSLATQLGGATVKADGKVVIENGALK